MHARPLDDGSGDKACVAGQAVHSEERAAALGHVLVEDVDALEVDPGAQAIPALRRAFARQCADEIAEDGARRLRRRVGGNVRTGALPRRPQMALVVPLNQEIVLRLALLAARRMIGEVGGNEREFGAG